MWLANRDDGIQFVLQLGIFQYNSPNIEMDVIIQEIWRKEKMKGPHLEQETIPIYLCISLRLSLPPSLSTCTHTHIHTYILFFKLT